MLVENTKFVGYIVLLITYFESLCLDLHLHGLIDQLFRLANADVIVAFPTFY